jgi:hypothetical protein
VLPPGECNYIVLNWVIRLQSLGGKFYFDVCLIETVQNVNYVFSIEKPQQPRQKAMQFVRYVSNSSILLL